MGSTYKDTRWRVRRDLLVAVRSGGLAGLSAVRCSVCVSEPFLGQFPGRANVYVWADST